jgi:hypothetical protein
MPLISKEAKEHMDTIKTVYGDKITEENRFLVVLIADIMARLDKLEEKSNS